MQVLAEEERPLWSQMSFSAAEENFHVGRARRHRRARLLARGGRGAGRPSWSCAGCCRWRTRASTGWGVDAAERDRLLGIIERRCVTQRNGASWQAAVFHRLYDDRGLDRDDALREMTLRYRELMHANEPVHDWPID